MKILKYFLTTVILILTVVLSVNISGLANKAQSNGEDEVIACNVLARLSENSKNWAEVIAYKNAFDFVKSRVSEKRRIAAGEKYFERLAANNSKTKIFFCMYLNDAPKNNCGFRNNEADNLLEIIERKMEKDHLSIEDIIRAIEDAKQVNNPDKFTPLEKNN